MPPADSPTTTDMDMAPAPSKGRPKSDLFEGFNNLNLLRQAGLMIGLAASVAIGFAVVLWTQGEDYRPLYASLDRDRKSTRLNSSHVAISYAVFCLKKKKKEQVHKIALVKY